jgi:hypothetical protein
MKIKTTIAVFTGLMVAVSVFGQGQVNFNSTPSTAVYDQTTGAKVANGVATAGLYYTTDLNAAGSIDPNIPMDVLLIGSTTAVGGMFAGVYSGGTVDIPDTDPGQEVLIQVRAWSNAYNDYAAAWAAASDQPTPLVGASEVVTIALGGGSLPVPSLSAVVTSFTLTPVPEPSTLLLGLLGGLGAMVFYAVVSNS